MEILTKKKQVILIDDKDAHLVEGKAWHIGSHGYAVNDKCYYVHSKRVSRKMTLMHRLLLNAPGELEVDHINGNKLDNRRANLRLVTRKQNAYNIGKRKNNTTGFKGVYKDRNLWAASIQVNGKKMYLGRYKTPEEAGKAYSAAALLYHKEYANVG